MTTLTMEEYALSETTVAQINGVSVAAGGAYADPQDGRKKVNLTIGGVAHAGLHVGDTFRCGNQTWAIKAFKKRLFQRRGIILLERKA